MNKQFYSLLNLKAMSFQNAQRDIIKFALSYTKGKPVELTQAVLAARRENGMIQEKDLEFQPGKKRQLFINYYAPICTDNGTGTESICDAGTTIAPKQMYFEITDKTASAVYQLNPNDIRYVDNGWSFSDHAKAQIMSVLPTIREDMNNQIAAKIAAQVGLLPDGNTTQTLPIVNPTNGVMNPKGLWNIERAYRDTGYSNPYIIGGTQVFDWKKATSIGGLNSSGQYVNQMGANKLYYDMAANDAFGDATAGHVISFDPEMLKFVSFNRNAGMFATDEISIEAIDATYARSNENVIRGVIVDPVTGLIWDLNIHYDPCLNDDNGGWKFQWKLEWDIFFMPPSVCNIQGVNGIFHWETCVDTEYTCPDGDAIEPATASVYESDLAGDGSPVVSVSYPFILQRLDVGGITVYPGTAIANIGELVTALNDASNGTTFSSTGTELKYTGYTAITVKLNYGLTGAKTLTFTVED